MTHTLFETPSTYRLTDAEMAVPPPQVEAVLFDFSNTIFHMIDLETWLRRVGTASGRLTLLDAPGAVADISDQLRTAFRRPYVVALQEGRDLSFERHRLAMHGWWEQVDFLRGAEEAAYRELTAPDAWTPYPDTEPVLRALHDHGLRIGIVSDFAWDLRTHLAHHGLDDLIDSCVISYEQGREKPDPQLFLKACADLGTDPRAALMVGDNAVRDGGATACGLRTYILPAEHRTGDRGLADVLRLMA
ncbi:HAD superfamily hydrolase (TIGR01493 family)/HAD superfamily hydrolase (TIGR01509 family)/HAD superfamily hydrolase (TIGR01549 family) [Streptomyces sp. SLBN-118]|uniref:HAD family hydrolase n=1 Tax=Streptomyces sp. SLBN-118 TaxID=2768454 RepID=UPI001152B06D|nr:HAD-IA family hydrolase [Streptomyces sp. SLBN-118]TQK51247.1 HAD superfamily hydrolase (TIGR01493 family)/HAD superfamily hydrolase (TIGR01509 family)/HAD superfamily hydrolase (TIGR01549 family) [Streptomyces sp. SLBN-118]